MYYVYIYISIYIDIIYVYIFLYVCIYIYICNHENNDVPSHLSYQCFVATHKIWKTVYYMHKCMS